eukprot:2171316-Rhodomonas_salina.1
MQGRDVIITVGAQLAGVLRTAVAALPFGIVAERLFEQVEDALKATARNNELAGAACERVLLLRSTMRRIIESRFQSTDIFSHYVTVVFAMHQKAI